MEINVTAFVKNEDPFEYSASRAERGENAGRETWGNAKRAPMLLTEPEHFDALRVYVKGFGSWGEAEIAAWTEQECNAIFVQLISGDMREAEAGQIGGHLFRGDDGEVYYSLSE